MSGDTFDRFADPERGRFGDRESADPRTRGGARVTGASDLHDLAVALHHQTDRAVLVSSDGDESKSVWLPKSRIEIDRRNSFIAGRRRNGAPARWPCIVITVPERLAAEKGLL